MISRLIPASTILSFRLRASTSSPRCCARIMSSASKLLVKTTVACSNGITLPCPSVRRAASRIWSKIFQTSGWAFSISSKRITRSGSSYILPVRGFSASCPMYPAGAPVSLDISTGCLYSLMSKRIIRSWPP